MSERNKGIFYGVVAVATLIVAIVGATLAYFSIYASSSENAVGFTSKVVSIDYEDGQEVFIQDEIIPSAYDYVIESYENPTDDRDVCIDDKGQRVCVYYAFTIRNNADAVDLEMYLKAGFNQFNNLKYMLYEITGEGDNIVKTNVNVREGTDTTSFDLYKYDGEEGSLRRYSLVGYNAGEPNKYSFDSGQTKRFELVMYLNEIGTPQNDEQGKSFAGTIEVEVAGQVTGCIGEECND